MWLLLVYASSPLCLCTNWFMGSLLLWISLRMPTSNHGGPPPMHLNVLWSLCVGWSHHMSLTHLLAPDKTIMHRRGICSSSNCELLVLIVPAVIVEWNARPWYAHVPRWREEDRLCARLQRSGGWVKEWEARSIPDRSPRRGSRTGDRG